MTVVLKLNKSILLPALMKCVNGFDGMANSVIYDQTTQRSSLIRVYIVCSGISVQIDKVNMINKTYWHYCLLVLGHIR